MAHFHSVDDVVNALLEYGYTQAEIEYVIGDRYDEFVKSNEELGIDVSSSDYIMGLIRSTEKYKREESEGLYNWEKPKLECEKGEDPLDDLPF